MTTTWLIFCRPLFWAKDTAPGPTTTAAASVRLARAASVRMRRLSQILGQLQVSAVLPMVPVSSGSTRRSALSVPNFRVYFVSACIAQCGGWLLRTAQAWLILDLTGSPAALAVVTIAQALPVTILTLFAGILIDRSQSR